MNVTSSFVKKPLGVWSVTVNVISSVPVQSEFKVLIETILLISIETPRFTFPS